MLKEKKFSEIGSIEKAALVYDWLDEKQGKDIEVISVEGLTSVTDIVMLVTARSIKHAQALCDFVLDNASRENIEYLAMEGYKSGDWILVDLNDVLVHIFVGEVRGFYNLEGMWAEADRIEFVDAQDDEDDAEEGSDEE